jgi:hypothetical protein
MKALFTAMAFGALAVGITACGGASAGTSVSSHTPPRASTLSEVAAAIATHTEPPHGFLNDGDRDGVGGRGSDQHSYHDSDDSAIAAFVSGTDPAEAKPIATVVENYYRALAGGDGEKACAMLLPSLAKSLPGEYGRGAGPPYLLGAKSCPEIIARVSRHFRSSLTGAVTVTGIHVSHPGAFVQLGSPTLPLTEFKLIRVNGAWKVDVLIGDHDIGDATFVASGSTASAANTHAVAAVVVAYYAALAAGDETKACSLVAPTLTRSLTHDMPARRLAYLQGARTCPATVARLSKHLHSQLADPVTVTGVHVDGSRATVLLGSRSLFASQLKLGLTGGAWKVTEWIGPALP